MGIRQVSILIHEGDYHLSTIQLDVKSKTFAVIEEEFFVGILFFHFILFFYFKELVSHPLTSIGSKEYSMKEGEQRKNNCNNLFDARIRVLDPKDLS